MRVFALFLGGFLSFAAAASTAINPYFSGSFKQLISTKDGNLSYSGDVKLAEDGYFWHYKEPESKRICAINGHILVIDDDLAQVSDYARTIDLQAVIKDAREIAPEHFEAIFEGRKYEFSTENGVLKSAQYVDEFNSAVRIDFYPGEVLVDCRFGAEYDYFKDGQ